MKQHNIHNDDALYQQIMAELKPGADEYDTMMAQGLNPAGRRKPYHINKYKYVAAACIVFAIIGASLGIVMSNDTETPLAQVTADKVEQKDSHLMAKDEAKANVPSAAKERIAQPAESITQEKAKQASSIDTPEAPQYETETDESEQEFLYALITEVEHEALTEQEEEEQFYRSIIEEVTENMSNATKTPELIL